MIRKLLTCKIDSITIAAGLVAVSSLVSRFLGIFRDRILAGQFGAGNTLDVYYAAFRIPDFIFNLIVLGAISAGFIPILTKLIKSPKNKVENLVSREKNNEAWNFANNLLNILGLFLIVVSILGIVFAPQLMKLIAPGFDSGKQTITANLTRIMFLSPLFLGISSILGGILQTFKRFFVYSLSPILYNIGIIVGALYFVPIWGVYGLAWGVVMGAFLHMTVQVPMVWKLGFRYKPFINLKSKELRKLGRMMVPRTMSLGLSQINLLVITIIASTLMAGSLAIFNFANNIQSFPIGIFGISFAIAAFPTLSAVAFDKAKLTENFSRTTRQILFFLLPATVLLLTLRAQIVRIILGTGRFDWQDTILTINTLSYFSISLFAQALIPLLIRVFYARHDSKTPFFIGLFSAMLNVILSLIFAQRYGVAGLALAFSLANIFNFIMLWLVLHNELGDMDEEKILFSTIKFSIGAIACGVMVQGVERIVEPYVNMETFIGIFIQTSLAALFGLFVYLAVCALFKSEELLHFYNAIKCRIAGKKAETGDHGEARGI